MKIVDPPIATGSNASGPSVAPISENPPACTMTMGRRIRKMPIVWMTNCTKSVSVIDHIPPSIE